MPLRIALCCLGLALIPPTAAYASLDGEQSQGHALTVQLASGAKSCSDLSNPDLDHIGEYVMGRMVGSAGLHQAMNNRMKVVLGNQGETRMHQLMGARFSGCNPSNDHGALGRGMMGAYSTRGYGSMMSSGDWGWMRGGTWRHMTQADWQRVESRLADMPGMAGNRHGGWGSWGLVALAFAGVLFGAAAIGLLVSRGRRPPQRQA